MSTRESEAHGRALVRDDNGVRSDLRYRHVVYADSRLYSATRTRFRQPERLATGCHACPTPSLANPSKHSGSFFDGVPRMVVEHSVTGSVELPAGRRDVSRRRAAERSPATRGPIASAGRPWRQAHVLSRCWKRNRCEADRNRRRPCDCKGSTRRRRRWDCIIFPFYQPNMIAFVC